MCRVHRDAAGARAIVRGTVSPRQVFAPGQSRHLRIVSPHRQYFPATLHAVLETPPATRRSDKQPFDDHGNARMSGGGTERITESAMARNLPQTLYRARLMCASESEQQGKSLRAREPH